MRQIKFIQKGFLPYVADISSFFGTVEKFLGIDYIEAIVNYMFEAWNIRDNKKFFEIIDTNLSNKKIGGRIMTIAQSLRREGKIEGKREGKREGREEGVKFALQLLKQGKSVKEIAEMSGLHSSEI